MNEYILNKETYAVLATYYGSKVITKDGVINIKEKTKYVINRGCKYYGSSLSGRLEGSRNILGITYKAPIVVSEFNKIVFLPTSSVRNDDCSWINLYAIKSYHQKKKDLVEIEFKNGKKILLKLSYGIIDKQILRASRLDNIVRTRKEIIG